MTDDYDELLQSGIAYLAADDPDWDDGPFHVHGVALGEGDITVGLSGKRTYWPGETLEDAADQLTGKPIVRNHPDPEAPQPPIEEVIGEVERAAYQAGTGIVFEAALDDPDIARQIDRGRADVSPLFARELGEYDEERDAHVATAIHAFRDLGVVSEGAAPSNAIQTGPSAAVSAMSAEALAASATEALHDGDSDDDPPADDDPQDGESPRAGDNGHGDGDTHMSDDDLTDKEREILAQARQRDDPTVVEAAAAEKLDDAGELLAAAEGLSAPTVVDEEKLETQDERLGLLEDQMTDALVEQEGYKPSEVLDMDFEDKAAEFEDEDGTFQTEALVQNPQTGDGGGDDGLGDETEALSEDDEERLEQLEAEIEAWSGRDTMESYVEGLREERAELMEDA